MADRAVPDERPAVTRNSVGRRYGSTAVERPDASSKGQAEI
jgi:hypothetical protein